jgi:hypothetical protein
MGSTLESQVTVSTVAPHSEYRYALQFNASDGDLLIYLLKNHIGRERSEKKVITQFCNQVFTRSMLTTKRYGADPELALVCTVL